MSYCLNPECPKPINPPTVNVCQACGSKLLLRDRYRLVKGLGKGGFGATFLAADFSLPGKPLCVIKQLRPATDNPQFLSMARELFEREAQTLGRIGNHPQIPRLLDYFEDRQQFYLVQEFVKGDNLQQEIKKKGPLSEVEVKQVFKEILVLLRDIHAQKVIHRDVKPANIIRREQDNKLVLIDFGVVKNEVNTIGTSNNSEQTALTAFAVGTPGFAPPEQLAMRPVYSSDIYALAITGVYLLTGKAPKNIECDPITGEMNWRKYVNLSDHFANILSKMLEVSVRHRYQFVEEVLKELDIEPHIDSLAQGLITQRNSTNPNQSSDPPASTAISKLAMTIRASQQRRRTMPGNYPRTSISDNSKTNIPNTGKTSILNESKRPSKLDSSTLLSLYAKGRRDFTGHDLNLLELAKVDLSGANFSQSKMIKVNLQEANLSNANFNHVNLRQSILQKANLGRAYLSDSNLEDADLRGADLSFANLQNANLKGANFCGANLSNAIITEEQLAQAKTNWMTTLPKGKKGFW